LHESTITSTGRVKSRRWRSIGRGAILLVGTLFVAEIGIRLSGYADRHIYDPIYMRYGSGEEIPYVHKPNLEKARARGLAVINTDRLGLRSKMAGARYGRKQPGEYRIAIAGDSGTFGEGVPRTEDTFAQVLEDELNRRQDLFKVQVFNFGVSAYSVREMAATLRHRMLKVEPDLVLMVLIDHDFVLARTPTVDASGYLVDRGSGCLGVVGSILNPVLRHVHLAYLLRDIGASLRPPGRDIMERLRDGALPGSYVYVRRFKEIAEAHGCRPLIVIRPAERSALLTGVRTQLREDRIPFVDLSAMRDEFSLEEFKASRFDGHPSGLVHHRIGAALAESVVHDEGWE
jgi:hypothetical protein